MKRIDLNELPRWTPWPARLLELEQWRPASRTLAKIEGEYNQDKYAQMLESFRAGGSGWTPEEVRQRQYGKPQDAEICMVWQDQLHLTTLREGRRVLYACMREVLGPAVEQAATVVELGCGFGYNLWLLSQWYPDKLFLGGDFSANAVDLASELNASSPNLRFRQFNFYDPDYRLLEEAQAPCLVLTYHALEQVPQANCLFEALARNRRIISSVFHFEPIYGLQGDDLMGLLRRRYIQVNDYNTDLWELAKGRADVEIIRSQANVVGLNPMNPSSVLNWRFR